MSNINLFQIHPLLIGTLIYGLQVSRFVHPSSLLITHAVSKITTYIENILKSFVSLSVPIQFHVYNSF